MGAFNNNVKNFCLSPNFKVSCFIRLGSKVKQRLCLYVNKVQGFVSRRVIYSNIGIRKSNMAFINGRRFLAVK